MIKLSDLCDKGHQMDLRITEVRENEDDKSSPIFAWLLMGVCKRCHKIIMQGIHKEKIEPTEGIDYEIIHKKVKGVNKGIEK